MTAAILDFRPAARPELVTPERVTRDRAHAELVRLFALDRPPAVRRQLVCRWRRGGDGRLACVWESDIGPSPLPI